MLKDFNLLVTTSRGKEEDACTEAWYLIGEMGDEAVAVEPTGIKGLIAVKTKLDGFEVVEKFRKILKENPSEFRYTLRVIPIEKVVPTDLNEIRRAVSELASKIKVNETFRVTVERRFTEVSRIDIIETAAGEVDRRVELSNPNKIVLIEVVNGLTGVSIIEAKDVLSVVKEKKLTPGY